MTILIDADLVAFRCAASVADDAVPEYAIARCDNLMREILHATQSDSYLAFLTGRDNFRKQLNPEYKANRKDKPLPAHLNVCREFLSNEWNCVVTTGSEADDYLGINQDKSTYTTAIASLDKDLLMIPGWHYNWVKQEKYFTDPLKGLRHFYTQMLVGDRSDNIFGVDGIGPVKAGKRLDNLETEKELIEVVFSLYNEDVDRFLMNANCLWIMQREGETWSHRVNLSVLPDQLRQGLEAKLGSMKFSMEGILMEPTTIQTTTSGIPVVGIETEDIVPETVPLT